MCTFIHQFLQEKKAQDIIVVDLDGKSLIGDYLLIASGGSTRHLTSMAQDLHEALKKKGLITRSEGVQQADWVLIDANSVIVHLFKPEIRLLYNLEGMWNLNIPEKPLTGEKTAFLN